MSVNYPLPRSLRRTDWVATVNQAVFGPTSGYLIFDPIDVVVLTRASAYFPWQVTAATVTLSANPGYATVTFATGLAAGTLVRAEVKRTHPRLTDVTRSGSLQTALMERELDTQATVLQELRRDINEAGNVVPQLDYVSPEDFPGFISGGDSTAAFVAALATGKNVRCRQNSTYIVRDLVIPGGTTFDASGSVFTPVAGSLYCFKMSGFRPRLVNARFSDVNSNLIRSSTLAAGVSAGSSTFSLNAGHSMQTGQAFWLLMDNGRPFMSHVAAVVGNTLTTTSPLISAVSSGRICRASFGAVYCNDTTFFDIFDVQLIGASAGIWIDGNDGNTGKGTIKNLRGFTYKHFGVGLARGVHEVTVDDYFLRAGFNEVTNATGNGVQTAFVIPNEVRLKRDIYITINGIPQTYTTNYTVTANGPSGATVTFTSAPANGAAIVIANYAFAEFGVWSDATGWNTIRGGSRFHKGVTIHHRVGRFIRGRELEEHANNQDDTASYIATWVKDCVRDMWFDNHYAGYAFEPILVEDSTSVNFSGRLVTWLTPSSEWVATVTPQAFAVQGIGGTTRVIIDPWGWTVPSDKTIFGAGSTVYTQIPTDKVTAGSGSMPFSNSWTNSPAPFGPLIAAKGPDNIVTLNGAIQSGSVGYNTLVATLPLGYRPARNLVFPVSANGAVAFVGVKTDGTIIQEWGPNLNASITSLGGISFEVA
jgi:hypothetical protein